MIIITMKKKKNIKEKHKRHQLYVSRKSLKKRKHSRMHKFKCHKIEETNKQKTNANVLSQSYKSQHFAQVLEYKNLFKDKTSIKDLLSIIPREQTIKIICILNNIYGEATIEDLDIFFASTSINNRQLVINRLRAYQNKTNINTKLYWTTNETPIQLLRHLFSIPLNNIHVNTISNEQIEMNIFKIILLMNQKAMKYKIKSKDRNLENLVFLNSVNNINMKLHHENERKSRTIMQGSFAIHFFKFLNSENRYKCLMDVFLKTHNAKYWQEYIRTILGIVVALNYKSGFLDKDLRLDEDHLINKNILESLCIPYDITIKYGTKDADDRNANIDYRVFRNKPIIKMSNGDYCIYNWEFLIDRLFNSLYFEFKDLPNLGNFTKQIPSLFTDKFAEKKLFNDLLKEAVSSTMYKLLSEDEMRKVYKTAQNELAPPDYILDGKEASIIFECKDIRVGGIELESHNFDNILDVYSNKLNLKKWKLDHKGNKIDITDNGKNKGKRIGVTQLTYHISCIRSSTFKYHVIDKNKKIYPVLILSDYKYIHKGFTHIANQWYKEDLGINYNYQLDKPLIVMSFITLIKYKELFLKNGFEYYFEQYYDEINKPFFNFDTAMNVFQSFDDYMSFNNFSLSQLKDEIFEIIRHNL